MSLIMAHRGARDIWAENSLLGFRETVKHDFDGIEFDLHLTDAGELVVIHDATLERTTNGTGPVRALTPESRKALRLKGPDGTLIDEGVPSFEEALAVLASGRADLYVELKADQDGNTDPRMIGMAADILRRHGLEGRSVMHAFDMNVVRRIRDEAPGFRRLISVNRDWADRQGGLEAFLNEVRDLVDVIGIHHELFAAEFDLIEAMGLRSRCSVWTINDPLLMRDWIGRAPGYLVSDNPVLLRRVMAESVLA
ncbi:glycerophosphodiester phosphodiesterase family protein [Paracoccus siganidrum]|uniref:Glycerophosphodiester phosphodiesterase n=1 Tax=Paracoccus siganidrum TaxID=1276757 RepID=A0A418ZZ00_9RHOB|nr:glycerophosphodiester phosphodiesterase family protein [Paracoccus siganidrum]RJL05720.1 glycerophosphodiester phosphodiesterase [Paracoccus siganidrum]RMC26991.1 glycerophosphodiester phosphodiesterase [Paracoccus siganidrum]